MREKGLGLLFGEQGIVGREDLACCSRCWLVFIVAVGHDDFLSKLLVFMSAADFVEQSCSINSFGVLNHQAQAQRPIPLALGSIHASEFSFMEGTLAPLRRRTASLLRQPLKEYGNPRPTLASFSHDTVTRAICAGQRENSLTRYMRP